MQAMLKVNDESLFNMPATFSKIAASTVKAKVTKLILLYVVILSIPVSRLWLTCRLHLFGTSP